MPSASPTASPYSAPRARVSISMITKTLVPQGVLNPPRSWRARCGGCFSLGLVLMGLAAREGGGLGAAGSGRSLGERGEPRGAGGASGSGEPRGAAGALEDVAAVHFAEGVGEQFQAGAVGVAEVE